MGSSPLSEDTQQPYTRADLATALADARIVLPQIVARKP